MDKKQIISALGQLRTTAQKRNFIQTVDIQLILQNIDLKKPEAKVETFVELPNGRGRDVKVCALIGGALYNDAKQFCDLTIAQEEFKNLSGNKKELKKLARQYDYFIAQGDIMPAVATTFGRFLGSVGKMPNPKAGAIIPPKGNIKPIVDKLRRTVKLAIKGELAIKCSIGKEDMTDEQLAENILVAYTAIINALPQHENNVKEVLLKCTMSPHVTIGGKKHE